MGSSILIVPGWDLIVRPTSEPEAQLWYEAPTACKSKWFEVVALKCDVCRHPSGIHQIAKVKQCTEAQPSWINSGRGR